MRPPDLDLWELVEMFVLEPVSAGGLAVWMLALLAVAFAVPFVAGDRLDLARGWYVVVLTVVTAATWVAAMSWAGTDTLEQARWHWVSGLVVAPLAALVPALGITRLPANRPRHGARLVGALGWDAVVYGAAEGLLLSALPAFLAWQWTQALAPGRDVVAAVVAVAFSVLVVVAHHLGYPEFRHPRGLAMAAVACGLLTVGYVVTGSIWAPVVGHVLLHAAAVVKGNALPPHGEGDLGPGRRAAGPVLLGH